MGEVDPELIGIYPTLTLPLQRGGDNKVTPPQDGGEFAPRLNHKGPALTQAWAVSYAPACQMAAQDLIKLLDLKPHPEGGFFRETYRSEDSTTIYFLLPQGAVSRLHRIKSDEVWHFYLGDPLVVVELTRTGVKTTRLGTSLAAGETVQHVVPRGTWFGAHPAPGSRFALVGCTVAPAFQFADFEMGVREKLLKEFPHSRDEILKLT